MTTWVDVSDQSTSYSLTADLENDYAVVGYFVDNLIDGSVVWGEVSSVSTVWT